MSKAEAVDVVVIGAGFAGLASSKAYLQCAPSTKLLVLDKYTSIGGVWAKENIYEGLRSNNLLGTFELPDFPMHEGFGAKEGEHIPGMSLYRYLCGYADHFGLTERMRLETEVLEAEKMVDVGDGWRLSVRSKEGDYVVETAKLIVATGLTSQPQPMHVQGQEDYNAPIINAAKLAQEAPAVLEDAGVERVTVFGGSKFAYDCVYMFAKAGRQVDWIMRKSGHGPTWMLPSHIQLPFGRFWTEELVTRRIMAWMSPCLWGDLDGSGWWRRLLHGTSLGRRFVDFFWANLDNDVIKQSGLASDPALKPLIPDEGSFWTATNVAILNYPTNIHDFVTSGRVRLHRQDISHLSHHAVHLSDSTTLPSDAFIASTGWLFAPNLALNPQTLHSQLGIPSTTYTKTQQAFWTSLETKADLEIYSRFPTLQRAPYPPRHQDSLAKNPLDTPPPTNQSKTLQPYRLYRGLAPPGLTAKGDRSIAFQGFSANIRGHIRNEISGLWIYAYMTNKLTIDPQRDVDDVCWEAALFSRFCYRRYPYGFGARFPDFVFDAVPFNDLLLRDLGLSGLRKGSLLREAFEPYGQGDYRGVTAEWLDKRRVRGGEKEGL